MTHTTHLHLALAALGLAQAVAAQLPPPPTPAGNPTTPDKVLLGKVLFWDEQLSSNGAVACGTCHRPNAGGGDPRAAFSRNPGYDQQFFTADDVHGSPGVPLLQANGLYSNHALFGFDVQVTGRTAPTMINAAFNKEQFWDGREGGTFKDPLTGSVVLPTNASLESQASKPPVGDAEMAHVGRTWADVANRIAASAPLALASDIPTPLDTWIGQQSYPDLFRKAYGDPAITPVRIIQAIAAYERTLISDQTPFDLNQLTPLQRQGMNIFFGKARCHLCHEGVLFRDDAFHNTGVRPSFEDLGRAKITGNPADNGAFKTPGLRNGGLRKAFFHNGGFTSLAEVIEFYDRGGDFFDNLDPSMQPLGLTVSEKVALLEFLQNGLLDPRILAGAPPFDVPTLYSESTRPPRGYDVGSPGSNGVAPRLIGIEPPVLGNPNFTLAFADGYGGQPAWIAFDVFQGIGLPVLGIRVLVAQTPLMIIRPLGALAGSGPQQGRWSGNLAIPNTPALAGLSMFLQGIAGDPGAPMGISATAGLEVAFFAPR
jgi:cytochrome c peroxidase